MSHNVKFHKQILKQFEPAGKHAKIILFGSLVIGNYRLDSDIDLVIITKDKNLMKLDSTIADKILAEHGKLFIKSTINKRTTVKLVFPIMQKAKRTEFWIDPSKIATAKLKT